MSPQPSAPSSPPSPAIHDNTYSDPEKVGTFNRASFQGNRTRSKKRSLTERNKCCRCLCCACCLPVWARYIVWFFIVAIIICVVVIVVLLGTFKMPTFNVVDVTNAPGQENMQITYNGSQVDLALGLIVNVDNPNVLPIRLKNMQATANLPSFDGSGESYYMGSGYLAKQTIPGNTNYNFTFPFTIQYDMNSPTSQTMLSTLLDECGLYGSSSSDGDESESPSTMITVSYTIHLGASVLFVTIHPTLSGSASFNCPFSSDSGLGLSTGLFDGLS